MENQKIRIGTKLFAELIQKELPNYLVFMLETGEKGKLHISQLNINFNQAKIDFDRMQIGDKKIMVKTIDYIPNDDTYSLSRIFGARTPIKSEQWNELMLFKDYSATLVDNSDATNPIIALNNGLFALIKFGNLTLTENKFNVVPVFKNLKTNIIECLPKTSAEEILAKNFIDINGHIISKRNKIFPGIHRVQIKDTRYVINKKGALKTTGDGKCGVQFTFIDNYKNENSIVLWLTDKSKYLFNNIYSAIGLNLSEVNKLFENTSSEVMTEILIAENNLRYQKNKEKGNLWIIPRNNNIKRNNLNDEVHPIFESLKGKPLIILVGELYGSDYRRKENEGSSFETFVIPKFYTDSNNLPIIEGNPQDNSGIASGVFRKESDFPSEKENYDDYSIGRISKYGDYNGFDDRTIDDAFEGDPINTWNVD